MSREWQAHWRFFKPRREELCLEDTTETQHQGGGIDVRVHLIDSVSFRRVRYWSYPSELCVVHGACEILVKRGQQVVLLRSVDRVHVENSRDVAPCVRKHEQIRTQHLGCGVVHLHDVFACLHARDGAVDLWEEGVQFREGIVLALGERAVDLDDGESGRGDGGLGAQVESVREDGAGRGQQKHQQLVDVHFGGGAVVLGFGCGFGC